MDLSLDPRLIGIMLMALIALLEPLTTLSFYAKLHPDATPRDYKKDGARLGLVIFIGMMVTFFVGQYMLAFFGLQTEYFRIAGAVVLFFIAFSMVRGEEADATKINPVEGDHILHEYLNKGLIIPLTFPLTFSAPGMAYVISMHANGIGNSLVSITLASLITGLIIMYGGRILRKLGEVGTHLIIRILGLFLMAVAIQTLGEMIFALIRSNFGA